VKEKNGRQAFKSKLSLAEMNLPIRVRGRGSNPDLRFRRV